MTTELIDARGLRCPWPVVRLARALRGGFDRLHLVADDPATPGEVSVFAAEQGLTVTEVDTALGPGWCLARQDAYTGMR